MWDLLVDGVLAELDADAGFVAAIGGTGRVFPVDQTRPNEFDCIEWLIVSDPEGEMFCVPLASFDIRMKATDALSAQKRVAAVEREFRRVVFRGCTHEHSGTRWRAQYDDGRTLAVAGPGLYARQIDGRFWIVSEKYEVADEAS